MRAGILHICTGLLVLLLVGFTGCSRKKVPLDEKKFTALLIDLHRADGTLSVARGLSGLNELKNYAYYNDLFQKYGITRRNSIPVCFIIRQIPNCFPKCMMW